LVSEQQRPAAVKVFAGEQVRMVRPEVGRGGGSAVELVAIGGDHQMELRMTPVRK
jgi:hypothetical protein